MRTWVTWRGDIELPGPPLDERDLDERVSWPYPPEWIVRFETDNHGWMIDVELMMDEEGVRQVTGIVVRSGVPTDPAGTVQDPWQEEGEFEAVVPREVQRLPLTRYARAAIAIVDDPLTPAGRREAERILMPHGTPRDQSGPEFYDALARTANELTAQGLDAVAEIATRKNVDPNTVHQWLFRARN